MKVCTFGWRDYSKDAWNWLDAGAVVFFLIGFFLQVTDPSSDAPRVILAIDFVAFSLRLIQMFSVHKVLGPKIVMIRKMVGKCIIGITVTNNIQSLDMC